MFDVCSLFSGGIIVLTFREFTSGLDFGFTILIPINSPVASAVLWVTYLVAVFRTSSPVFVAVSNSCFLYLFDRFFANEKNPCPLMYFFVLGSI